ncbi:TrkA-N domain protein [Haloterrigena turkmenica DSM 5511]|uniref:TrkA-N domain protein n=1 Tax=Haloterrigena turkmenica (strain ATCC 51198 / DSM 5511 / JCM 9101 / NCIMB 13204 / VKM B-1734 / 4k) TaxID=543526 RepID=D2RW86_HALTV|nr:NAD-binding protein [Haloterrigena turkmenica]ADB59475.1 TrkA-N domain protein [Haloterrigena turkmenica DSM 5511]
MADDRSLRSRLPDNWHRVLSMRAAVALALIVAGLSVATAIVNIGTNAVGGPLSDYVPEAIQSAAAFTGALTGFLMVGSALALRRGLRVGWWATLLLLPLTAAQGLLQSSPYSVPLVVLSLLSIPMLLVSHKRFDKSLSLSTTQIAAGFALLGVQAYGTFGAYALREDFEGINTILDAFYFTLITSSTVGYGDVTPDQGSTQAMLFTMSVLVLGVASFGIAIGALVGPAIQARITKTLGKMTDSQLELLEDHVLVLGYGELTEPIVDELATNNREFVVVTGDREAAETLTDRGLAVIRGDPSDEEPLQRAKIDRASAILVATNHDAEDALSILTARQLAPETRIVSAATDRENTRKLEHAGADAVISPSVLGGHLLVQSALGADESELIEYIMDGD